MDAIVAVYSDWGIGAEGTQPIVIPEDRRHFAKLTRGAAVIVGRRTMEDFPGGKPLKDRENLVITRHADEIEGATIVRTAKDAVEATKDCERVFVIGGATVYMAMFQYFDRIYVTKIGAPISPTSTPCRTGNASRKSPSPPANTSAASVPTNG